MTRVTGGTFRGTMGPDTIQNCPSSLWKTLDSFEGQNMKIFESMPRQLMHGWDESGEVLKAKGQAGYHYHEVEEWLEVTSGDITFFTLTNQPYKPAVNQALQIPRGEVHRVEAGSEDVKYQMWLPRPGALPEPG